MPKFGNAEEIFRDKVIDVNLLDRGCDEPSEPDPKLCAWSLSLLLEERRRVPADPRVPVP